MDTRKRKFNDTKDVEHLRKKIKKMEREMRKLKRTVQKEEDEKRRLVRDLYELHQKYGLAVLGRRCNRMEALHYEKQRDYWHNKANEWAERSHENYKKYLDELAK